MTLDAIFLVGEPPGCSPLYLARLRSLLKITDHGGYHFVVGRIQVVENGLGQMTFGIETVEEAGHG